MHKQPTSPRRIAFEKAYLEQHPNSGLMRGDKGYTTETARRAWRMFQAGADLVEKMLMTTSVRIQHADDVDQEFDTADLKRDTDSLAPGSIADVWHEGSRAFYKAEISYRYEGIPPSDPDDYEPERAAYLKAFDTSTLTVAREVVPLAEADRTHTLKAEIAKSKNVLSAQYVEWCNAARAAGFHGDAKHAFLAGIAHANQQVALKTEIVKEANLSPQAQAYLDAGCSFTEGILPTMPKQVFFWNDTRNGGTVHGPYAGTPDEEAVERAAKIKAKPVVFDLAPYVPGLPVGGGSTQVRDAFKLIDEAYSAPRDGCGNDDIYIVFLRKKLSAAFTLLQQLMFPHGTSASAVGTSYTTGYNADGSLAFRASRSSSDVSRDNEIGEAAIELYYARVHRDQGNITPQVLWKHVMGDYPVPNAEDESSPAALIDGQIGDLLEGVGASEDHENVREALRFLGLTEKTVVRAHEALATFWWLDGLRKLCGYVEDGSCESIRIGQDDATKGWALSVGRDSMSSRKRVYYGPSFGQAIVAALDKEKPE